jgi:hypothetical protein
LVEDASAEECAREPRPSPIAAPASLEDGSFVVGGSLTFSGGDPGRQEGFRLGR